LDNFQVGPGLGEGPRVEQIGAGEPAHGRKRRPQVNGQAVNHPGPPSIAFLALQNVPADPPVEPDQLGIDRQRRTLPGFLDPSLEFGEPGAVAGRRVSGFERHDLIPAQAQVAHVGDPDLPDCRWDSRAAVCPTARWTNLRPPVSAEKHRAITSITPEPDTEDDPAMTRLYLTGPMDDPVAEMTVEGHKKVMAALRDLRKKKLSPEAHRNAAAEIIERQKEEDRPLIEAYIREHGMPKIL
jgi:hypothetical protein